ncbi:hypothetical protein, partial [Pantoea ananatis]|uniref:hypothetical protein n=1 Tax=Pantoea ananas TaxID=553 RepID=UPI001B305819
KRMGDSHFAIFFSGFLKAKPAANIFRHFHLRYLRLDKFHSICSIRFQVTRTEGFVYRKSLIG